LRAATTCHETRLQLKRIARNDAKLFTGLGRGFEGGAYQVRSDSSGRRNPHSPTSEYSRSTQPPQGQPLRGAAARTNQAKVEIQHPPGRAGGTEISGLSLSGDLSFGCRRRSLGTRLGPDCWPPSLALALGSTLCDGLLANPSLLRRRRLKTLSCWRLCAVARRNGRRSIRSLCRVLFERMAGRQRLAKPSRTWPAATPNIALPITIFGTRLSSRFAATLPTLQARDVESKILAREAVVRDRLSDPLYDASDFLLTQSLPASEGLRSGQRWRRRSSACDVPSASDRRRPAHENITSAGSPPG
jgi:hypothetical protein